jgi:hypothetical protein
VSQAAAGTSGVLAAWTKLTLSALVLGGALYASRSPQAVPERPRAPERLSPATERPASSREHVPTSDLPVVAPTGPALVVPSTPRETRVPAAQTRREPRTRAVHKTVERPVSSEPSSDRELADKPSLSRAAGEVDELALLQRAQRALRDAPRRALDLAAQHRALYPHGDFAEERDVTILDALARVHDDDALRAGARAFLQHYPNSFHTEHVRRLLAR